MIKNDYIIRLEEKRDHNKTENLVREAFWNVYKPGCDEHYVLHCLRSDADFVPQRNFVMEKNGEIIGQIVFVKAVIATDDGCTLPVLTFGPVCIHPNFQGKGLGKTLIDFALDKVSTLGFGAVLIEGNIKFYRKCGFTFAREYDIRYHGLPVDADDSFFLCKELQEGYLDNISGVYSTPKAYFVSMENPSEFDQYEKTFPPKEKLKLPGQLV